MLIFFFAWKFCGRIFRVQISGGGKKCGIYARAELRKSAEEKMWLNSDKNAEEENMLKHAKKMQTT